MNYVLWLNEKEEGPYAREDIEQALSDGSLLGGTLARPADGGDWKPLQVLFPPKPVPPSPKPAKVRPQPAAERPSAPSSRNLTFLIAGLVVLLGAAGYWWTHRPPEKPKISEIFKTELLQYLKDGGKLSTQSGEGINLMTLESQLTDAKATFDLLEATWPPGFVPEAHQAFAESHKGYSLAARLWKGKISKSDEPTEPDINGWSLYLAYAGSAVRTETHDDDYIVADYRGKRFLPFDKNISVFLTLASTHFNKGRQLVLNELK